MDREKHTAIVLAAGRGSRMKTDIPKQFLKLNGKPVLYYSLKAFEDSFIDEIILVTGEDQEEYCRTEIVEKYRFTKISRIISGGRERFDSVYRGLCALKEDCYVYIHDGARPFVDMQILQRARQCVKKNKACAAGMPVKDTIKMVDDDGFVVKTPLREYVWQIQTPQVFSYSIVKKAYDKLYEIPDRSGITDDAMVVERMLEHPVKLFEGSYQNIKITTPEDLPIAEIMLKREFAEA